MLHELMILASFLLKFVLLLPIGSVTCEYCSTVAYTTQRLAGIIMAARLANITLGLPRVNMAEQFVNTALSGSETQVLNLNEVCCITYS